MNQADTKGFGLVRFRKSTLPWYIKGSQHYHKKNIFYKIFSKTLLLFFKIFVEVKSGWAHYRTDKTRIKKGDDKTMGIVISFIVMVLGPT